jgi:hypothetical protein
MRNAVVPGPKTRAVRSRWPLGALLMVGLGIVLLAAPDAIEGPVLLPISPGHALSRLDTIALLPLLAGTFSLYYGLWQRRARLRLVASHALAPAVALVFIGGFGLGLLIASAFSAFFWWWAIGALLFATVLLSAVFVVTRAPSPSQHVPDRGRGAHSRTAGRDD